MLSKILLLIQTAQAIVRLKKAMWGDIDILNDVITRYNNGDREFEANGDWWGGRWPSDERMTFEWHVDDGDLQTQTVEKWSRIKLPEGGIEVWQESGTWIPIDAVPVDNTIKTSIEGQGVISGPRTEAVLTVLDQANKKESLSVDYGTVLEEPIGCLVLPYGCKQNQFTKVLNMKIKLNNVDVSKMTDTDYIEVHIGFDKSSDIDNPVLDKIKLRYNWNKDLAEKQKGLWTCSDMHSSKVSVAAKEGFWKDDKWNEPVAASEKVTDKVDQYQDCTTSVEGSSVTFLKEKKQEDGSIRDTGKVNFVIDVNRNFNTNEKDYDAQFSVGDKVPIYAYGWKTTVSGVESTAAEDPAQKIIITVLNNAKKLLAAATAGVAILAMI